MAILNEHDDKISEDTHTDNKRDTTVGITKWNYIWAFCAALNSCNLGYDIGVGTDVGLLVTQEFNLTTFEREAFTGSIDFWSIFGALGAFYFTDRFGRRMTFAVAAVIFLIGVILLAAAPNYYTLLLGRVFLGLGIGTGFAIDPLYIAEVTPAKHRGELVTWSEIATNVGLVLGFSTGLTFNSIPASSRWRYMSLLGGIFPVIMIFLVTFVMPESPRWLVANEHDEEAKEVLKKLYPDDYDIEPIVDEIKDALKREEEAEKAVGWGAILRPTPALRRMLLVGIGISIAQQVTGIDAIQYYLLDVLSRTGIQSSLVLNGILLGLGIIKMAFVVVGGKLFDRTGRRPLLFTSLLGMAGALLAISVGFYLSDYPSSGLLIPALAVYLASFSIGMGPGAWLIPSEVFPLSIRAKAMSLATCSNRLFGTLMSTTFLSTAKAMGWGSFFLLICIVCLIACTYLYLLLPETKGKTLEEMTLCFAEVTGDTKVLDAERAILSARAARKLEVPYPTAALANSANSASAATSGASASNDDENVSC